MDRQELIDYGLKKDKFKESIVINELGCLLVVSLFIVNNILLPKIYEEINSAFKDSLIKSWSEPSSKDDIAYFSSILNDRIAKYMNLWYEGKRSYDSSNPNDNPPNIKIALQMGRYIYGEVFDITSVVIVGELFAEGIDAFRHFYKNIVR